MDHTFLMSDTTYRLIRELIYKHCGLAFDEQSRYLLEKRLSNRLIKHQISDFQRYYHFLMYDRNRDQELKEIIDLLTVNETYFFREDRQLKAFSQEILPEISERKKAERSRSLRIWSAGCSTGEEPYTLAILILQTGLFRDSDVEIFASDISQRVLKVARKGEYKASSFRTTDPYYIRKYFTQVGETSRIIDPVRRLVNFGYLNLFDHGRIAMLGTMDLIFCRNVIIYFDKEAKQKVMLQFEQRLRKGGYLLLGHSESLINISNAFRLKHLKHDMVYEKA
ncbi:MAG: protein-glutamate O-methyltransferase CheR [bacterium]|nr:protein-glutamate O-methyltransferase CheR [bacterium]